MPKFLIFHKFCSFWSSCVRTFFVYGRWLHSREKKDWEREREKEAMDLVGHNYKLNTPTGIMNTCILCQWHLFFRSDIFRKKMGRFIGTKGVWTWITPDKIAMMLISDCHLICRTYVHTKPRWRLRWDQCYFFCYWSWERLSCTW